MRDIGKNIKDLRQARNLTQEELAEKLFVTRQTVSNYETGRTRPDLDMLMSIAQVLGTDANAVLYGPPDAAERERKLRRLAVLGVCLLALAALCWFLAGMAADIKKNSFDIRPALVVNTLLRPMLYALVGWTVMEAAILFGGVKVLQGRARKIVVAVVAVSALLYLLLVLPPILSLFWPAMPNWVRTVFNWLIRALMGLRGIVTYQTWIVLIGGALRMIAPERNKMEA